ncbi:MAG: hypothetical protein V4563_14030 [Pseudomonadota bacterium]
MITKTQSFSTSDGKMFQTLEEAQAHSIALLVVSAIRDSENKSPDEASLAVANIIVVSKDQLLDILTTTAKSKPSARKINGGTKKRAPKPVEVAA